MRTLPTLAALALLSCGPSLAAGLPTARALATDIAAGADRHDWDRVRAAFAEEVTLDYTSLWDGEPTTQPAEAVIAQWSGFLPGFEATHHMVANVTVTDAAADTATAEADFTATHRIEDTLWTLGGRYTYGLVREGGAWKVAELTMTALWETGDRDLVARAAARAAAGE